MLPTSSQCHVPDVAPLPSVPTHAHTRKHGHTVKASGGRARGTDNFPSAISMALGLHQRMCQWLPGGPNGTNNLQVDLTLIVVCAAHTMLSCRGARGMQSSPSAFALPTRCSLDTSASLSSSSRSSIRRLFAPPTAALAASSSPGTLDSEPLLAAPITALVRGMPPLDHDSFADSTAVSDTSTFKHNLKCLIRMTAG